MKKTIVRNVKSSDRECKFTVINAVGLANAIRRALMNDVQNVAPKEICFTKNTTCQTDEYISHRIGLIPFTHKSTCDVPNVKMSLSIQNETAFSRHLVGDGSIKPCEDIPIIKMTQDQELELEISFELGTGGQHSRFSHIGPVSYKMVNNDKDVELSFTSFGHANATEYVNRALLSLLRIVDEAILFMDRHYDTQRVVSREVENMEVV